MDSYRKELSKLRFGGFTGLFTLYLQVYLVKAPSIFLFSGLSELSMIVILWIIAGSVYLPTAIIGSMVSIVLLMGTGQLSIDLRGSNHSKFRYMLVASPVNPAAFILAISLGASIHLIIQTFLLACILLILKNVSITVFLQVFIALFLLWICGISIGYYLSIQNVSNTELRRATQIFRLGLIMFAPIYYPIRLLPFPLQVIALVIPTTNVAIILRNLVGISDDVSGFALWMNWFILLLWTVSIFVIAIKSSRWEDM